MNKVGRNDPCPCGSGKKYKQCHMKEDQEGKGKGAKYTPSGKRKFTAKVLKSDSLSVFGRSASTPQVAPSESDRMEKMKFKMTSRDFQVKGEEAKGEAFEMPPQEPSEPTQGKMQRLSETFQPTQQDFREKKKEDEE